MRILLTLALGVLACAVSAQPVPITLTHIGGTWNYGNTDWDGLYYGLGAVNNSADLSRVNSMLSGPYTYQPPYSPTANGIYYYWPDGPAELIFSVDGETDAALGVLTIQTSRNQASTTVLTLDYSNDGGSTWLNALTTTTGDLNWHDWESVVTADFGGVAGNAFRLGFNGTGEVSLHAITLAFAVVPEPSTVAFLAVGGLVLIARRSRR